jgi:hypothetical protein
MDCVNAICDVLSGHDNDNLDDNDKIHDEGRMQKLRWSTKMCNKQTNVAMEAPCIVIRFSTIETRMNRRIKMHNMLTTPSNKEATQQWTAPAT